MQLARAMDGISINGLEWLLDDNGELLQFDSTPDAKEFLRNNGFDNYSDEDLEDSFYFQESED